ncbi:protein of unknown function [Rhodovastum atsumiense]|nr:protein of unknown function [Rhodovastum atsumiense]
MRETSCGIYRFYIMQRNMLDASKFKCIFWQL